MLRSIVKTRLCASLCFAALLASAPTAWSADTCAQPLTDGSAPTVRDCIAIARASLGSDSCRDCVCDTNGSGGVSIADALRCLWFVVGADVTLDCPPCDSSTTTTLATCASCSEVLFHTAEEEELCESSQVLYDTLIDCPCGECADECVGFCDSDPETNAGRLCLACYFDRCRQAISDCVED